MSKSRRSKHRKRKSAGSSDKEPSSGGRQTSLYPWVAVLFFLAAVGLLVIVQPWSGNRAVENPRRDRPSEVADAGTALDALRPTPSGLPPEKESALLKKEERQLIEQLSRDFPEDAEALVLLGNFHARHGDSDKAGEYWERALQMSPGNADVYTGMAEIALEKGNVDEAITLWRKTLEIRPGTPRAHRGIAEALVQQGEYEEAIGELEKELRAAPRSAPAHLLIGEAYMKLKEYDRAKQHYETSIQIDPTYSFGYYGLYTVHTRLKQPEKARDFLARFKELKSKEFEGLVGAGRDSHTGITQLRSLVGKTFLEAGDLYRKTGNERKAENLLKSACRLEPNNVRSLEKLATLYCETKRISAGLELFGELTRIDPSNPNHFLNIGQLSIRLNHAETAEAAFRKVIELSPDNSAGYRQLARLYLRTNRNLPEARQLAEKALRMEKVAESYFIYGWASDVNGDREAAVKAIEQAIQMEPTNSSYRQVYDHMKRGN